MIKIVTWNVKGLLSPHKRSMVLRHLGKLKPDIALLQETHLAEKDFFRMRKFWVGEVIGSPAVEKKNGVLMLFHKNLSYSVKSVENDTEGRLTHAQVECPMGDLSIYNIYGPNSDNHRFFQHLRDRLLTDPTRNVILGGDLNTVMLPAEDRKRSQSCRALATDGILPDLSNLAGLVDTWRLCNPDSRDFTFFSAKHKSWSRIDYLFVNRNLQTRIESAAIHQILISDHAPVSLTLADAYPKGGDFVWRFPSFLAKDDSFKELLRGWWLEFSSDNEAHKDDPTLFWETAKAVLRGRLISYLAQMKRRVHKQYLDHSVLLRQAYTTYMTQTTPENLAKWKEMRQMFELWLDRRERFHRSRYEADLFRFGSKSGRMLARLAKGHNPRTDIIKIRTNAGQYQTDPRAINTLFQKFYRDLYSDSKAGQCSGTDFLSDLQMPSLSPDQLQALNADISAEEVQEAIKGLHNNKAPGPDGYPAEFYKILQAQISPILTSYFNGLLRGQRLSDTVNTAYIKILPKQGRDLTDMGSYRPISLINQDLKLVSKIMANRLAVLLPILIGPSQVGFVKGRAAVTNIRKVLGVMDAVKAHALPSDTSALVSLDAEKAFDNIRWQWLNEVLDKVNLTGNFRCFLDSLYFNPSAAVYTPGFRSDIFRLHKGTRQGCPLSPLLFNLALEPLLRTLEQKQIFTGIRVGTQEVRTAAFADDILLFMADPGEHLSKVLDLIKHFGSFAGFKINPSKCELLGLSDRSHMRDTRIQATGMQVAHSHITYLGTKIGRHTGTIYPLNYPPLFDKIIREFKKWETLPLSLFGRCQLVKMISFS